MSQATKYMFDRDFTTDDSQDPKKKPKPVHTEEDMVAANQEAETRGYQAGLEAARLAQETAITGILESMSAQLDTIEGQYQQDLVQIKAEAVIIVGALAQSLCRDVADRTALERIETTISQCLAQMPSEPRLVIRLERGMVEPVIERIDVLKRQTGFSGKLIVIEEPNIASGDCRLEWADGGAERRQETLFTAARLLLAEYLNCPPGTLEQAEAMMTAPEPEQQSAAEDGSNTALGDQYGRE